MEHKIIPCVDGDDEFVAEKTTRTVTESTN